MITEFEISDYIRLKLEEGKTNIYVEDKLFNHCKYLLLNLPFKNIDDGEVMTDGIESSSACFNSEGISFSSKEVPDWRILLVAVS